MTHLVVGVDGSPASQGAMEIATDIATRLAVGVSAVLAFEPLVEFVPESDRDSWRHHAEAAGRRWVAGMSDAGVPVDVLIDRDVDPVAAICRVLDARPRSAAVSARTARPMSQAFAWAKSRSSSSTPGGHP